MSARKKMELQQEFEMVEVDRLQEHPRNPRKGNTEVIRESIEKNGFYGAVIVQRSTGRILAGNHRWKAAKMAGESKVPVAWVDVDEEHATRILLADNRTNDLASYNDGELTALLVELNEAAGLEGTGYTERDLEELLAELQPEIFEGNTDPDDVPEEVEPRCKRGDIWRLGEHRLMCGDSTNIQDLERLMAGEKADLWITDPPYNVALGMNETPEEAKRRNRRTDGKVVQNDSMSDSDFRQFLRDCYSAANCVLAPGASFYIWHADSEGYNFRGAAHDIGWKVRQCLIWAKSSLVMGRQDYQWQHEPCLYGWTEGAAHTWNSDRKQSTLLRFDKPSRNGDHPTMKPVDLFQYQIDNSTRSKALVLDSFGGSGTTVIACERIGRRARILEIDPSYCDVIIKRWEEFTERTAIKVEANDSVEAESKDAA